MFGFISIHNRPWKIFALNIIWLFGGLIIQASAVIYRKAGKIALFGNGARKTVKGGTGSGDVNSRNTVNIEERLKKA